jgi:hypothetical protein
VSDERDTNTTSKELSRQLVLLLANVTVLTALLVYFGWARTERQAHDLGIDESLLSGSTQSLVMRSVGQVLYLLLGIGVLGLAAYGLDLWARSRAGAGWRPPMWLPWASAVAGVLLPVVIISLSYLGTAWVFIGGPVSLAVGFALLVGAARLVALRAGRDPRLSTLPQLCVLLIFGVLLFWTTTNIAIVIADNNAARFIAHEALERIPVTIVSTDRLWLTGPGVVEERLDDQHYRYSGLELMDRFDGRVLLIAKGWQPGNSQVIVLNEGDKLHFSFG